MDNGVEDSEYSGWDAGLGECYRGEFGRKDTTLGTSSGSRAEWAEIGEYDFFIIKQPKKKKSLMA